MKDETKVEILTQIIEGIQLRLAIKTLYQHSTNPKDIVRCSEVAASAANLLGLEDSSNHKRAVRRAAKAEGFNRTFTRGNVPHYRFIKRKETSTTTPTNEKPETTKEAKPSTDS